MLHPAGYLNDLILDGVHYLPACLAELWKTTYSTLGGKCDWWSSMKNLQGVLPWDTTMASKARPAKVVYNQLSYSKRALLVVRVAFSSKVRYREGISHLQQEKSSGQELYTVSTPQREWKSTRLRFHCLLGMSLNLFQPVFATQVISFLKILWNVSRNYEKTQLES